MEQGCLLILDLSGASTSPDGFPFFSWKATSVALLCSWVEEDFIYHQDPSIQEILPAFRTLTNEAELFICIDTEPPWLSTALIVGPFEEEEMGIGTASDVVKI